MRFLPIGLFVMTSIVFTAVAEGKNSSLANFQKAAAKFNSIVTVPTFEATTNEVAATVAKTIAEGNSALDTIGKLTATQINFTNTFIALDDVNFLIGRTADRLSLIEQTSTNADVRDAATDAIKQISEWSVGIDYRDDVYRALKTFADTKPQLAGEDKKTFGRHAARLSPCRIGFAEKPTRCRGKTSQGTDRAGNGLRK